jgi:hypothetical protein
MPVAVLAELPILAVSEFDSRSIITVVFCGDPRLTQQFRSDELLPIASPHPRPPLNDPSNRSPGRDLNPNGRHGVSRNM